MLINKDYHVFTLHGDTIMNLPSGELFLLDELASDLIKHPGIPTEELIKQLASKYDACTIEKARREMEYILSQPVKDHRNTQMPRNLRAMCLNITHKCNLACTYCFAERLTNENAGTMTPEIIKGALDYLCRESGEVHRLQVDFFGGEPLLAFDLVKMGTEYGRELEKKYDKKFLFTLTTNALLLNDEVIDFVKEQNMSLILSLDGTQETHDLLRPARSGKGSHDTVLRNIKKVQTVLDPSAYYIRGTFTSQTLEIKKTLEYYLEQGFINVSLEPVSSPDNQEFALTEKHRDEIIRQYRETAAWLIDKPLIFYHFNLEMDNPLCLTRRITGCGAGVEYIAVDPAGNMYPCHQFIEDNRFIMGNVLQGKRLTGIIEHFRKSTIYEKEECQHCWARFYCSGGCHFQHFIKTGDINKPSKLYCDIFKGRLEAALWFNVKRRNSTGFVRNYIQTV
jgi:uncharacterized protein